MATQFQIAGRKNFSTPDELREFPKGKLELVQIGDVSLGRATFESGWKWSESVKPIAHTDTCLTPHLGYVVSGHMNVRMDDGQELAFGPGDALSLPPGHDAWTVGNEPCVIVDFVGFENYARPN